MRRGCVEGNRIGKILRCEGDFVKIGDLKKKGSGRVRERERHSDVWLGIRHVDGLFKDGDVV